MNIFRKFSVVLGALVGLLTLAGCAPAADEPFDYDSLPFYQENIDAISYDYSNQHRVQPFWLGNVIYNEAVMVVEKDGIIEGELLYEPLKLLAVYDWKLETEYEQGKDYRIEGNRITLPEGSRIPVFNDRWAYGKDMPEGYEKIDGTDVTENRYTLLNGVDQNGSPIQLTYTEGNLIFGNYIYVSYVYDPAEFDASSVNTFENKLPLLTDQLQRKEKIDMMILGDSVSEGCSASATWGNPPYCPFYGELVRAELERVYGAEIELMNISVGGKTSSWGCELPQKMAIREKKPDFLIIGFGLNDFSNQVEASTFVDNIDEIVLTAKEANENCSIVLLHTFPANPLYLDPAVIAEAGAEYHEYAEAKLDVAYVSMFELGMSFLETKEYYEISASNINHPNDFFHRCYAMNILCSIVDYNTIF